MDDLLFPILCLVLSLIFFFSAIDKFRNWNKFLTKVEEYRILPKSFVKPANILILIVELYLVGAFLTMNIHVWDICIFLLLMTIYSFAISINLYRGNTVISCGCGGPLESDRLSISLVIRNLFLMIIGSLLLFVENATITVITFLVSLAFSLCLITLYGVVNLYFNNLRLINRLKSRLDYFQ
jgi:Methylamine utilisation protein MauE